MMMITSPLVVIKYIVEVRIVEDWNSLPEEVVSVKTVLQFETRLDKIWIHKRFDDSGNLLKNFLFYIDISVYNYATLNLP